MTRIQRKRTKGWKSPPGSRYCGRPFRMGNPFKVGVRPRMWYGVAIPPGPVPTTTRECVEEYRTWALRAGITGESYRAMLRWELRDATALSCWCGVDKPCHVDVILEILEVSDGADKK